MLKVKGNIDLKELEKFGFSISFQKTDYYVNAVNGWVCVDLKTRELFVSAEGETKEEMVNVYNIGIIYDLIKADLVEKVE